MLKLILLIAGIICFVIAALASHGTINTSETATWGYAGLALGFASFLPLYR